MRTHMMCPGDYVASDTKQIDSGQAEDDRDSCAEGNGRYLSQELRQDCNCEVSIIVVIDAITCQPHIVWGQMRTTHNCCKETLIQKHFKVADIWPEEAQPAEKQNHPHKHHYVADEARTITAHPFGNIIAI